MFAALLSALAATTDYTTRAVISFASVWGWGG
jgi:hypothetical protein